MHGGRFWEAVKSPNFNQNIGLKYNKTLFFFFDLSNQRAPTAKSPHFNQNIGLKYNKTLFLSFDLSNQRAPTAKSPHFNQRIVLKFNKPYSSFLTLLRFLRTNKVESGIHIVRQNWGSHQISPFKPAYRIEIQ